VNFWNGKTVLITGHTGFKGSWLSLWLQRMGAKVIGYSLTPLTEPNLYVSARVAEGMISYIGDIRNAGKLREIIGRHAPDIVFHLAAQPLVRKSYEDPVETFDVNVMGTVKLLESLRSADSIKVVVNVTTDKCYDNKEWEYGYREIDPLGGHDPYSSSKGCAEMVTDAFRRSFFRDRNIHIGTARAGNVIGGGDWAEDRLIPDLIRASRCRQSPLIRNPYAVRPWQHVLEPLGGYLMLAESMWTQGARFAEAWNFGPNEDNVLNVGEVAKRVLTLWGSGIDWVTDGRISPHEAQMLKLDCSKAALKLGWTPKLSMNETLTWTVDVYKQFYEGADMRSILMAQISDYELKVVKAREKTTTL
jgi:CDP-glucose 4,6-dehydratase